MSTLSRRTFLGHATRLAAAGLLAPGWSSSWFSSAATTVSDGADLLGQLVFLNEGPTPASRPQGAGLAGRLALDLSTLSDESLVTPAERFYIRTRVPRGLPPTHTWSVLLDGLADRAIGFGIAELRRRSIDQGVHLLECAGNGGHRRWGLLSAARWRGVPVAEILAAHAPRRGATRVLIDGNDDHGREPAGSMPGAGWIFTPEQLADAGAFLATEMNGEPLPSDHGFPVRLLVPGWYGCCAAKWVQSIRWVDEDEPATSQMREYAGRTHQGGVPNLARDYRPAENDLAAMPIRVEMWRGGNGIFYSVVGIIWGGKQTTDRLEIQFGRGPWAPVERYDHRTNRTWSLWSHRWRPRPGRYHISLRVDDAAIRTRRLDHGYYARTVEVPSS